LARSSPVTTGEVDGWLEKPEQNKPTRDHKARKRDDVADELGDVNR
jgi:hypothetical protein